MEGNEEEGPRSSMLEVGILWVQCGVGDGALKVSRTRHWIWVHKAMSASCVSSMP